MFSSNQALRISGDLRDEDILVKSLQFALGLQLMGKQKVTCYQIEDNGTIFLGWGELVTDKNWVPFQWELSEKSLANFIIDNLRGKKPLNKDFGGDGSHHDGYLIRNPEYFEPPCGAKVALLAIEPFRCYYAK